MRCGIVSYWNGYIIWNSVQRNVVIVSNRKVSLELDILVLFQKEEAKQFGKNICNNSRNFILLYRVSYFLGGEKRWGDTAIREIWEGGGRGCWDMPHRSKDHEIIKDIADTYQMKKHIFALPYIYFSFLKV